MKRLTLIITTLLILVIIGFLYFSWLISIVESAGYRVEETEFILWTGFLLYLIILIAITITSILVLRALMKGEVEV